MALKIAGNVEITISLRQVLKAIELGLTIACAVLQYFSFTDLDFWQNMLVYGVFCMYLNIIPVLMSSSFLKYRTPVYVDMIYMLVGSILFIMVGTLSITLDKANVTKVKRAKEITCFSNGGVMLFDFLHLLFVVMAIQVIGRAASKDLLFSIVGCVLFWSAGAVGLKYLEDNDQNYYTIRLKSEIAVVNGCVLLVDVLFVNALLCTTNLIHRYLLHGGDVTRIHHRFIEQQDLEL